VTAYAPADASADDRGSPRRVITVLQTSSTVISRKQRR
jgi:hypothetical protein